MNYWLFSFYFIFLTAKTLSVYVIYFYLQVSVAFAGKEIPNSPINVKVESQIDISKVKVDGLEPSKLIFFHYI